MTTTVTAKIQVRKGTAAQWTSANPVLLSGEIGYETDTLKLKFGDGTTAWTSLAYHHDPDLAATYAGIAHNHSGTYEPADTDLQAHLINTSNPHSVTAVQVGADASGTAAGLIVIHEAAANPHPGYLTPVEGDAAYAAVGHAHSGVYEAAGAISTHAAVTSSVHGISAFGATLVDDADAGTARSTLGLGTAATTDTTAYATAAHNHSGVYEPVDVTLLRQADVDDAPVNGVTTAPVSSNWAYDHAALTTAHGISSFGATLVDDADASTARSTLGLGTAAVAATGDFAPTAKGVTNGDSHDHSGGDGAQIAYSGLSGLPTLGTAAATDSTAYATAAQGSTADSALQPGDVDDAPVNGATTAPISSNWAYDHAAIAVVSNTTGITGADQVTNIVSLTQAEYDAIGSPSATTFYITV